MITGEGRAAASPSYGTELRRSPRVPEHRPGWLRCGSHSFAVTMVDLSREGACFLSPRALGVGRAIRLQVGSGPLAVDTGAIIVRRTQCLDGGYSIGVRFVEEASYATMTRFSIREGPS